MAAQPLRDGYLSAFDLTAVTSSALRGSGRADTTFDQMAQSIAGYEASAEVTPFTSKFDAVLSGKVQFTTQEQVGYSLFRGKARCNGCHRDGGPGEDPLFKRRLFGCNSPPGTAKLWCGQSGMGGVALSARRGSQRTRGRLPREPRATRQPGLCEMDRVNAEGACRGRHLHGARLISPGRPDRKS